VPDVLSHFDAGPRNLTIAEVATANFESNGKAELKLVATFMEPCAKKLVLNLARAEAISDIAGDENTDTWPGTRVTLCKGSTRFQGQRVPCMAIKEPDDAGVGI